MKKFKIITTIIISSAVIVFMLNIIYLLSLYNSIAEDVERDVIAAMVDMDIDELWQRVIVFQEYNGVQYHTIQGSLQAGSDTIVMKESDKEGNTREVNRRQLVQAQPFANQMMTEMSDQMHQQMDAFFPININDTDSILRCRLAERGINPDFVAVEIVDSLGKTIISNSKLDNHSTAVDVFRMPYGLNHCSYQVYMTPLLRHIIHEMAGVIITTFLLIIIFSAGFWYLLHTVNKLRSIEEMKDDFVSNMTHELKTPISIAYSANDALLNFDTPNDPERRKVYLNIAIKQLKRLGELVESILAMSMERRKSLTLKSERISLPELANEIVESQRMKAGKDISINVKVEDNVIVSTDRTHLSNVLNNLIDNAIKYSGNSVEILISIDKDKISVADNGIGIPAKSLPFIFDKFYRVPHGNRQDVRGYGIGLYYVRNILEKMGWGIAVKSHEGKGSVFTIKFNSNEN